MRKSGVHITIIALMCCFAFISCETAKQMMTPVMPITEQPSEPLFEDPHRPRNEETTQLIAEEPELPRIEEILDPLVEEYQPEPVEEIEEQQ